MPRLIDDIHLMPAVGKKDMPHSKILSTQLTQAFGRAGKLCCGPLGLLCLISDHFLLRGDGVLGARVLGVAGR